MKQLDAAAPLVIDTRPLGRRAGTMITVTRTVAAPNDWAVSSNQVVPGTPVDVNIRLEAVVEGVLVSGTATVVTQAECSRCLDPIRDVMATPVQQLFEFPDVAAADLGYDSDPFPQLQGELLDFEPVLRDAVVLDLPQVPLCAPDCPGLCPTCGTRMADDPAHHHQERDERWAGLQQWLSSAGDATTPELGVQETTKKGK